MATEFKLSYTGSEINEKLNKIDSLAAKSEIPNALPNPYPLTINGKSYNGSEAVDIQITGGTTSDNILLGQTPITLLSDANVKLIGSGDYTYGIKGKTVADLTNMQVESKGATLIEKENYIEIVTPDSTNWYDKYIVLKFNGLTVGESYIFAVVGMGLDTSNRINNGYYQIRSGTGTDLGRVNDDAALVNSVQFTATTTNIEVRCYAAGDYYYNSGYRTARVGDIYLNNASEGTDRTLIIDDSGTFTDTYALGQLSKGVTITSTPSCEVYSVNSGGSSSSDVSAPLAGKTVVCFGDSLFGMYTGDTSAPAFVAQKTGATVYNVGFGGCRMSEHPYTSHNPFCMYALSDAIASGDWSAQDANAANGSANFPEQLAILKGIDFNAVDYIVIHYGTNDFTAGGGVAIDDASNPKATNTLCGALRYSIEKLLGAYPKLQIFVSLPVYRFWTEGDVTTYAEDYVRYNYTLMDFAEALRNTAVEYNLPVIDGLHGMGVNKHNASVYLSDGTHHNVDGRKLFGEYIGAKLTSYGDTFYGTDSENGGANIDVTAEVGQTIVVEEVDANGKPTRWKAADYQPRTHWTEEVVILPETTLVPDEEGNLMFALLAMPSIGDICKVTYNGTEYECEAADGVAMTEIPGTVLLGNASLVMGTGDTGEPFVLAVAPMDGATFGHLMPMDGSETFVLSIKAETVTKLPAKYIPDEVAAYAPHYIVCSRYDEDAEGNTRYKAFDSVTMIESLIDAGRQVIAKIFTETQGTFHATLVKDSTGNGGKRTLAFSILTQVFELTPQDDGFYLGKITVL